MTSTIAIYEIRTTDSRTTYPGCERRDATFGTREAAEAAIASLVETGEWSDSDLEIVEVTQSASDEAARLAVRQDGYRARYAQSSDGQGEQIKTASDCRTMSAGEVLSALCPRRDVYVEQDWDRGETRVRFDDGSSIIVSGRDVQIVDSR